MRSVQTVVNVLIEIGSNGRPVFEELLVEKEDGHYRLLRSPGLVIGLDAGDLFDIDANGSYQLLTRGRNLCIQVFTIEEKNTDSIDEFVTPKLTAIGGRLDGKAAKQLVYTIAVEVGFESIEKLMRELGTAFPGTEWYYGNVYDPNDGVTPLGWWGPEPVVS